MKNNLSSKHLTAEECLSIYNVIQYTYDDEFKDYESYEEPPEDHIFLDILNLISVLNKLHKIDSYDLTTFEEYFI